MLVIWDFDGVICDSDGIWAQNWCDLLESEKGIILSASEKQRLLIGISERDKVKRLEAFFDGLRIDDDFKRKLNEKHDYGMKNLLVLMPGVEDIFADKRFIQCIATGGNSYQNITKNHTVGIDKYFNAKNCFTADMVQKGKPDPEIFLLAAQRMNVPIDECVAVEDSPDGLTAAKKAGMKAFAFVGAAANNTPEYRERCRELGADGIFDTMSALYRGLEQFVAELEQNSDTKKEKR